MRISLFHCIFKLIFLCKVIKICIYTSGNELVCHINICYICFTIRLQLVDKVLLSTLSVLPSCWGIKNNSRSASRYEWMGVNSFNSIFKLALLCKVDMSGNKLVSWRLEVRIFVKLKWFEYMSENNFVSWHLQVSIFVQN